MAERIVSAQVDFGGGQVDEDANRRVEDSKIPKAGARIMSNWRQRNTGTIEARPGRAAICYAGGDGATLRTERFRMSSSQELLISFPTNAILITDLSGNTIVFSGPSTGYFYAWTNLTANLINWTKTEDRLVFCFPGAQPQVAFWDPKANFFTFAPFTFGLIGPQYNKPFFRFADPGVTLSLSGISGAVFITASAPIFTPAMVGVALSIGGYQCGITQYVSSTQVWVSVFPSPSLPIFWGVAIRQNINRQISFPLNTLSESSLSKVLMETCQYAGGGGGFNLVCGMLLNNQSPAMIAGDFLVSAFGTAEVNLQNTGVVGPAPIVTWQQEFMNFQNWPSACFFAHQRLGFCDFPLRPEAILWSSPGNYNLFWVDSAAALGNPAAGASADSAILEFIEGQPHVRNVVEWNGDEFVFTDQGVYYIPIVQSGQAFQPGTARFAFISDATCSGIKPAVTRDALIFTSASDDRVSAIIRTGNFTTPYAEQDLTAFHSQLINNPVTICVGRGDEGFPERYIFVLNADGSVVVGRMQDDRSFVGWLPWTGAGTVSWISQGFLDIIFNTNYGSLNVVESMDPTNFLDHAVNVATPPPNLLIGGLGPFRAFASGTVRVMDGMIDYGLRKVSATGFLVKNPDDDFSSPTIVAGKPFTSIYSPFMPEAALGQAQGQRQRRRKITRASAAVYNSNGFTFGGRTIPPFDFGANPFAQPALKETTYLTRPLGRAFDPTIQLIKDNPGPLTLVEFALELTV